MAGPRHGGQATGDRFDRRSILKYGGAGAVATGLAGCQSPDNPVPGGVSDWSPIYDEIESENCDVALVGLALSGTTAVNQWAQQERQFEFGGIHVPSQAYAFQFTPPDAEYAHEPQWTSMEETGVPLFQQWQHDPEVREDYGTMHSFAPEQNKTAEKTVPEWLE